MASIINDPGGKKRIGFTSADGSRKSLRLGKVSKKDAEFIKFKVEALVVARITGHAIEPDVARWVASLEPALADKLAAVGLIQEQARRTLGDFLDAYTANRQDVKGGTLVNWSHTVRNLKEYFGTGKPLREISAGDGEDFRHWLKVKYELSESTVRKRIQNARQFFRYAMKKKLVTENPFAEVQAGQQVNPARLYFVSREDTEKVLAACPNGEWRLLVALARFGGLRIPSEIRRMKWEDVCWSENRLTVHSPKTEHHPGGELRVIPLFPELRTHLQEQFEQAEPGAVYVFSDRLRKHRNPPTTLKKIIRRAGVKEWPKPLQNLRSTRETELAEQYPLHVVCDWIGNSQPVAAKHYLQITDDHFRRAAETPAPAVQVAQNPTRTPAEPDRTERNFQYTRKAEDPCIPVSSASFCSVRVRLMGDAGFEPATSTV